MNHSLLVVQHVDHEGPDLIRELAIQRGMSIQTIRPDLGEVLLDPASLPDTIAVVLGGPMGVNDRNESHMKWLQRELEWLSIWHQQKKPVLGICLGAQLLAVAAGGSVGALEVGDPPQAMKELGIGAIHWLRNSKEEPLLDGLDPSALVLHWHGDRIRLPHDATLLGSSLHCPEQVFRIGRHAFGLQCHLEISGPNLERWIQSDAAYIVSAMGRNGANRLRSDWERLGGYLQQSGSQLFSNMFNELQNISSH
ncbi:Carbamoyl-phosphate synthase small chain [Synechococcus sp. MIT S9509]|uniref:type 1 glutamine amidotransferase n=1 Tax=unclassified Synechococcus TaxID=2626047 RepID=UPI0007BC6041|nr:MULTISPECIES: type 1 glutamine amidotransferase [unclassified Synechococcus]KZR84776.1 Carbamoyl-phosphate synthase small chain [Synechococcus sp. MIT S9504]KZR91816.1 Carbamoyl-phosphate synthase small chain [Synechococcus sp. MIT S9509]